MEQFFIILLASIIWTVSPIGVMFWLAMAVQFSRKPDSILTVIARIVQGLALRPFRQYRLRGVGYVQISRKFIKFIKSKVKI